jgi:CRISPR-associated endonuclease/helicase Cas3
MSMDFTKFFMAVNQGREPFKWQTRLLNTVLATGRWPDRIVAPTGSGKTSAIDVHVFATAYAAVNGSPRPPRRLAMVVDRRVLVDDQYQRACDLGAMLDKPERDLPPVVAEVARVLRELANPAGSMDPSAPPLATARLRGGSVPSRSWRDRPTACAVLCATPDMWGSRLLFHGYATSNLATSREAGLLAYDSVVLVDEAHLVRQLLATARRVAQLASVAEQPIAEVSPLQVVEVTATPDKNENPAQVTIAVTEDDLEQEELLKARLTRPKPVTLMSVSEWPGGRQPGRAAKAVAQAVLDMRARIAATGQASGQGSDQDGEKPSNSVHTIGCYVNSVQMALAVSAELQRESLRVVTVCGQVRPADIRRLTDRDHYENLLTTRGNDKVDVIVSTQSLEVGADLDLAGIVTELASGSALAQRVGRVNRLGIRKQGLVTVVMPDGPVTDKMSSGPYGHEELREAASWLRDMAADDKGLSPWRVRGVPQAKGRRTLYQRPELGDAWHWARTSDDLAADPELDLWLSDSFEEESSVGIIVRDALPSAEADALAFARDLPPAKWEPFPVPYKTARAVLRELLEDQQTMVRIRGEEVSILGMRPNGNPNLRPGDQVVVDSSARMVTQAPAQGFSPLVVVAPASADEGDRVDPTQRGNADDVLHYQPDLREGTLVLRIEWSPGHEKVAGISQATARRIIEEFTEEVIDGEDKRPERERRSNLARLLGEMPPDEFHEALRPLIREVSALLRKRVKDSDVILRQPDSGGARVVVLDNRKAVADEDLRQVFAPRGIDCVLLENHQNHVAERAGQLASSLQLETAQLKALVVAGLHHDDGKADHRFQKHRLRSEDPTKLLAKSSRMDASRRQVQKDQAQGGLPDRWRHEQRSVVDSWAAVHDDPDVDHDLVLRLIGTSHGRGRSGFPHTAAELAGVEETAEWQELAAALFDEGGWDELIEATHLRYGVWGCAYLEAVLRAADCQISGEGK